MRLMQILGWLLFGASVLSAQDAPPRRAVMIAQYSGPGGNRILEVSGEGKLVWEHKVPSLCVMFNRRTNRNVVYAYGGNPTGVREVDRDQKVVWDYVSSCKQVLSCERLVDGSTLVGEQGPCQIVQISPEGNVLMTVKPPTSEKDAHHQLRVFHRMVPGTILAALEGEGAVREVDAAGKVVWEFTGVENVFEAQRLRNGNTIVSCGTQKRVIEVTPVGKVVWELTAQDVPEVNLTWVTSVQVLKNGNYLIGNFLRGQEGKGAHAFEVTHEKKVVWTFADHEMVKTATMVRAIEED